MKRMVPALVAFAFCGLAATGFAQAAEKLWEVEGLKGPECALPDAAAGIVYVSNVDGKPDGKDGQGAISRISMDGKMLDAAWVSGLDAPKGLAMAGGLLYVADIDTLVVIDIASATIKARHVGEGAKLLNDVAVGADGAVYVSDTMGNAIYRLADGAFQVWVEGDEIAGPNGLLAESDRLVVNTWGILKGEGWATETPGHMLAVSLADKSVKSIDDGTPIGNLDGMQRTGEGVYLITDWMAGKVMRFDEATGKAKEIMDLGQGTADLGHHAGVAFIPQMMEGKLFAYRIE